MNPLIHEKSDLSTISRVPEGGPKKYDVLLYKVNGKYILHRLIRIKKDGSYIVLGDNRTKVETYVKDDMIIGVLTGLIRKGKTVDLNGFKYKAYVHLWCDCYHVRIFCLKMRNKLRYYKKKLTNRQK